MKKIKGKDFCEEFREMQSGFIELIYSISDEELIRENENEYLIIKIE